MQSTKKRRQTKGSKKREQIRRAAYLCFRDTGYHDTSVDAICQRSGISKGSFYWHYSAKQDVFLDILENWAREVMDELYEQFEEAMNQEDSIGPLTGALEREIHRGRALIPLWLEFSVHARRDKEIKEKLSKFYRRARAAITEILRPSLEGRFTEQEMQSVSATIFGAYTGLMIQDLSDPERADAREMVRRFMKVIEWWLRQIREGSPDPMGNDVEVVHTGDRLTREAVSDFLSTCGATSAETALALQVREEVLKAAPEANERIIRGWKVIAYDVNGLLAHIKVSSGELQLAFYHGAALPDPSAVLVGRGKHRRHLPIPLAQPLDALLIHDLMEAALTFQRI